MEKVTLRVADYTMDPGPRYKRQDTQGEMTSGEEYYVKVLNKVFTECYQENKQLELYLDEVSGYPSSFLDEAIGELVFDFGKQEVERRLIFTTAMFKRRVQQVREETYVQWEKRREKKDIVQHSEGLRVAQLYKLNAAGQLEEYSL